MTALEFMLEYCAKHPHQEFSFRSRDSDGLAIRLVDHKTQTRNQYIIPSIDLESRYLEGDGVAIRTMMIMTEEMSKYMENLTNLSKFLSLILRHKPEAVGIKLDEHGWANVDELIAGIQKTRKFDRDTLEQIVSTDAKRRYSFNDDKTKIRANQGHSIHGIDLDLVETDPPPYLYHGTAEKFLPSIEEGGLIPMSRQYVHLTTNYETAVATGKRHGKPVVLLVKASDMQSNGYKFYLSENNVWLTERVPTYYLSIINESPGKGLLRYNPNSGEGWIFEEGEWRRQ